MIFPGSRSPVGDSVIEGRFTLVVAQATSARANNVASSSRSSLQVIFYSYIQAGGNATLFGVALADNCANAWFDRPLGGLLHC